MRPTIEIKKIRSVVLQTATIAVITLFLAEMALRVFDHYYPTFIFYSDSHKRFRGKPFAEDWDFKLNAHGFKDLEFTEKRGNAHRILGIGDSFAFGVVPYQYNYLTLIEAQLQSRLPGVEVLNMGIPDTGPKDYFSLLLDEGLAHQPDMVLLSFFVGNDFDQSKKKKFHEYSYVASLIRYVVNLRKKYEGSIIHGKATYCDNCPSFGHEEYLKIEGKRSQIYLEGDTRFPPLLDKALYYLVRIHEICDKKGIDLVVVIIPDELQINQDLERDVRKAFYPNLANDGWNIARPNRALSRELSKKNIDHIDLHDSFVAAASAQLYRPRDTHWNIAGNQLAANVIKEHLQRHAKGAGARPSHVGQGQRRTAP